MTVVGLTERHRTAGPRDMKRPTDVDTIGGWRRTAVSREIEKVGVGKRETRVRDLNRDIKHAQRQRLKQGQRQTQRLKQKKERHETET